MNQIKEMTENEHVSRIAYKSPEQEDVKIVAHNDAEAPGIFDQ